MKKEWNEVNLAQYPADISLNTYIRNHAQLPGTKFMCLEGGCGACIVSIRSRHPVTGIYSTRAANSCLTLLNICDTWDITTIEGIGNRKTGYHPIQQRLAEFNGTQCGYCSPGMVMNMYSLLKANDMKVSMEQIENSFGGNICRCTGYRPILDAMKSFSTNTEFEYLDSCKDIEDLTKECPKTGRICIGRCKSYKGLIETADTRQWFYPSNLIDIFKIFRTIGNVNYKLVGGGTGHGVYRSNFTTEVFIDINSVPELHIFTQKLTTLELGGNISLADMMKVFDTASRIKGFEYCRKLQDHIDKVANVPVRSMGTLAGNLMLKYQNNEFPHDLFIILTAVGATITIINVYGISATMTLPEFLKYDMTKKIIVKIILPILSTDLFQFGSYKIAPRAQNAHAYVNAGFLIKKDGQNVALARICFGGIKKTFTQATETENYLKGNNLFSDIIFRNAIKTLASELQPEWVPPESSSEYRIKLACGLFYKFVLSIAPAASINPIYKSGSTILQRGLSSGTQVFDTHQDKWPLTKAISKLEALVQCSGEAAYTNDLPHLPNEVWGAFVLASQNNVDIAIIDASEALAIPGVVAFYSAKDIPGKNSFTPVGMTFLSEDEEVFCSKHVKYHSQPVGMVVAESFEIARQATLSVKITYEHHLRITTLEDHVLKRSDENVDQAQNFGTITNVKGRLAIGGQYHFTMEPQTTICIPIEDGMTVNSSTQWVDATQVSISEALNIKENSLNLKVRRLGGSYGSRISRSTQIAVAAALACSKLNRPVRFVMDLETMMSSLGKRCPNVCDYVIDADEHGVIQKASIDIKEDVGCSMNENPTYFCLSAFPNCYKADKWNITGSGILTSAPGNTFCRAPGTLEAIANAENIMEHIARIVNLDPVDVRLNNMSDDMPMKAMFSEFVKTRNYYERKLEIENFNKVNRWRKRGIATSVMRYPIIYFGSYPSIVTVYQRDGTVAISHGGIESGQGINTKVAQVAATILGIPLSSVIIKPTDNLACGNSQLTGGSITRESACSAVKGACENILARMKPVKDQLSNPTWLDVVTKCFEKNVSLIETHAFDGNVDLQPYDVYACACAEMEVDILTGAFQINRVDILEDTGESLSPLIDVGQVEGGFIMGVGLWLTEDLIYDRRDGKLLNNRSWNYKVPGAKDIPCDFRINLLQKSFNPAGFMGSKTTGEMGVCLSVSTLFALRHALDSARVDAKAIDKWFPLGAPTTPENVVIQAGHDTSNLALL